MSARWNALLLWLACAACGPGPDSGSVQGLEILLSRAYVDRLGSFQVSILAGADGLDREAVEKTCVTSQAVTYVQQVDGSGQKVKARTFEASVAGGQQELKLAGIPFGREYLFVVEALSSDEPAVLLGSGSARVLTFQGDLRPVPLTVGALAPAPACDPRIR
ncbi:MAG: hypothetical protein FJ086_06260 [Deltaproteobacteria bacterium]|nr:hypothetical protein [Deltaproteobacteria bacterium]